LSFQPRPDCFCRIGTPSLVLLTFWAQPLDQYWKSNQEALKYYVRSLPLFKAIDSKKDEAIDLSNIGSICETLKQDEEALKYYEQAFLLFKAVQSKVDQAIVLNNTGAIYYNRGEKQKALRYYSEALTIARELKDAAGEARSLNNMALIEDEGKDGFLTAFVDYAQPLGLARTVGDKKSEALVFYNMMRTSISHSGSRRNGIFFAKQSVNACQELRTGAQGLSTESQKSFLRDLKSSYEKLAELLIWEGDLDQAVRVLDLYQDQRFFDFDRTTQAPAQQIPLSAREQEYAALYERAGDKIAQTRAKIDDLEEQIGDRKPTEREAAQAKKAQYRTNVRHGGFPHVYP
jgi:tetratricopeptide (TPR) repeat protein